MRTHTKTGIGLVGTAAAVATIALASPAQAASGHSVRNLCGNWAGANHAISMESIYGSWDLVPCGRTWSAIVVLYYGGPGYMKVAQYPNTCIPSGSSAVVTANTTAWSQATCY